MAGGPAVPLSLQQHFLVNPAFCQRSDSAGKKKKKIGYMVHGLHGTCRASRLMSSPGSAAAEGGLWWCSPGCPAAGLLHARQLLCNVRQGCRSDGEQAKKEQPSHENVLCCTGLMWPHIKWQSAPRSDLQVCCRELGIFTQARTTCTDCRPMDVAQCMLRRGSSPSRRSAGWWGQLFPAKTGPVAGAAWAPSRAPMSTLPRVGLTVLEGQLQLQRLLPAAQAPPQCSQHDPHLCQPPEQLQGGGHDRRSHAAEGAAGQAQGCPRGWELHCQHGGCAWRWRRGRQGHAACDLVHCGLLARLCLSQSAPRQEPGVRAPLALPCVHWGWG